MKKQYGVQKLFYFTFEQVDVLKELKQITGDSYSQIVRDALNAYMSKLKGK